MDMTPTHTSNTTNTASTKSPEPETETPSRIQPIKPISFTNGVLKRYTPHHHHNHHQQAVQVSYKECLRNHAAALGGYSLDGCGEFMPSPSANPSDPTSLKCAVCFCHRNFHRREPDDSPHPPSAPHVIEYQPHHRHHPPPPPPPPRTPNSASPPPISSYPASAPHMLLALTSPVDHPHAAPPHMSSGATTPGSSSGRKRYRTKFTQTQKERMFEFAERVGWKMQKSDEELVHAFCAEVGVERSVLKVWMHNNKNTFRKKDGNSGYIRNTNLGIGVNNGYNNNNDSNANDDNANTNTNNNSDNNFRGVFDEDEDEHHDDRHQNHDDDEDQTHYPNSDSGAQQHNVGTNGSSSP